MLIRSVFVWSVILVLAFANGALRELLIVPRVGDMAGRAISSVLLAAAILLVSWFTISWIRPPSSADAWIIGLSWLALTLAFEFLAGHYLFGDPWTQLLAEYNVWQGRLWILVPLTTLLAPVIAAQ